MQYVSAVFNETVTIVEDESGFSPETGFLYVVFAAIVLLGLLLGQQMLSKVPSSSPPPVLLPTLAPPLADAAEGGHGR